MCTYICVRDTVQESEPFASEHALPSSHPRWPEKLCRAWLAEIRCPRQLYSLTLKAGVTSPFLNSFLLSRPAT